MSLRAIEFPRVSASVGMTRAATVRVNDLQATAGERDRASPPPDSTCWPTDGVLVRMMPPGSLEQVVFRMDALHRIAAAGIPVLNPPRAVEAAVDKYLTLSLLERAGIPVPADVGRRVGDRGARGLRGTRGRRGRQAALRIRGTRPGADQRRGARLADVSCARTAERGSLPPARGSASGP